jgi:hypothetical protein
VSDDSASVRCPYCREKVVLYVDPETDGTYVEDCEVCCRPWQVTVSREKGKLRVQIAPGG